MRDPRERIEKTAAAVSAAGIPDELNRWRKITEAELAAAERKVLRTTRRDRVPTMPRGAGSGEMLPRTISPAGRAILRETRKQERAATKARLAALRERKATTKESAVSKTATKAKAPAKASRKAKEPVGARKGSKTKAAAQTARTPVSARPDGLREGSKLAIMLDLAARPEGVEEQVLLKTLGWVRCRVTLARVCETTGYELRREKDEAGTVTFLAVRKETAS